MEILIIVLTVFAGLIGGIGGAYVQGRFQLREVRQAETQLADRLKQVEKAAALLDPLKLARQLFHRGQYMPAVEISNSILETEPDNAEAYYVRGQAYAELRESLKAVTDLRNAVNRGLKRGDVYLYLALSESALGHWGEAVEAARNAIDPNVDRPIHDVSLALTLLGDALRRDNNLHGAITVYEQCLERVPGHTPAIDGAGLAKLVLAKQGQLNYDEVIQWYDEHIKTNPRAASTITNRGIVFMSRNQSGDIDLALRDFEAATAISPRGTGPYEAAGRILLEQAEGEEDFSASRLSAQQALEVFRHALSRATRYYQPVIWNWLSYTYQVLGEHAKAVQQAQLSVGRSPGFPANHQALCCALLAAYEWDRAIDAANSWLTSQYASESLPGRIWIGGFLCLARLGAGTERPALQLDLSTLYSNRLVMAEFRLQWVWGPAKKRVLAHMEGKGENLRLAKDIVALLAGEISPESFHRGWLR